MADDSELPLSARLFLKAYRWRRIDPVPCAPMRRPLSAATVAIVSTGGMVLPDQPAYDDRVRGGDSSFRVIPSDADVTTLIESHRSHSFDHDGIRADENLAFPLDRLRELARDGVVGRIAPRHLSFMGSITATQRLTRERAPAAAHLLAGDGVDVALLVPV